MPYDKEHKRRRRNRRHHKCGQKKVKMHEHQNRSYWWLPAGCQVAPTAPSGQKQLCEGHAGHYIPRKTRYGNIDTYGRLPPESRSKPAPVVVTRRWSSVEIGAHQIVLESTLPLKSATPQITTSSPQVDKFEPKMLGPRYRSSTFTRGAIDHDIVRTVREKLTLRKVPHEELATPTSITLRRASGESGQQYRSTGTGESTPLARDRNMQKRRMSTAYLITAEDIDSITELIEENLKRNFDTYGRYDLHTSSLTPPSQQRTPSPCITSKGLVPTHSFPTELAVTVAGVQSASTRPQSPLNYLQVVPEGSKKAAISRTYSQKSVHEVIWEGGGSPRSARSASSVADEDDGKRSAACFYTSEPPSPAKSSLSHQIARPDKGDAFDPKNANASINEWSWRCPQNEISVVVTSSDSDSNELSPECTGDPTKSSHTPAIPAPKAISRARARPPLRSAFSETKLQDVVSFPPLAPRKKTNDWYSPLPPMEMSPPLATSRSLYDIGIDVTFGPESSKTITPKSSQTSWVRSAEVSPSRSVWFNPDYEMRSRSPETNLDEQIRRKSVIKAHPNAFARTGDSSTVGSSLGASSGERRKSSTPSIQRARSPRLCESAAARSLIGTGSSERQYSPPQLRSESLHPRGRTRAPFGDNVSERESSPFFQSRREPSPAISEPVPERPPAAHTERRRSSTSGLQRVRTIDNVHKGEHAPPSKWRAPSPCPTPRSPSPSEYMSEYEDARELLAGSPGLGTNITPARSGWSDRPSLIRAKVPPLPSIDRVGIYGRMTGGQGMPRGDPCEAIPQSELHVCEDCPTPGEPHVCDDCANDPRKPSVDWIG